MISLSLTTTEPETGSMKPVMVRSVVVFPQPEKGKKFSFLYMDVDVVQSCEVAELHNDVIESDHCA